MAVNDARIDFLLRAYPLKDEERTGWVERTVADPETVAGHSWGVGLLCVLYAEEQEGVDVERALKMSIVHDIAEAETGDFIYRLDDEKREVSDAEKERLEEQVFETMLEGCDAEEIREIVRDYKERRSRTAKFVKDMDMIDMCLQALLYETEQRYDPSVDVGQFEEYDNLDSFFATTEARLRTAIGRQLYENIRGRYEEVRG